MNKTIFVKFFAIVALLIFSVSSFMSSNEVIAAPTPSRSLTVSLANFNVSLNGTTVQNSHREYPLILYKEITYFPMTYHDCRYLGLFTNWDSNTSTLIIEKGDVLCAYRNQESDRPNTGYMNAEICDFNIIVNGKQIDNSSEQYPLLLFRNITYFPLTWRFAVDEFSWQYKYDAESGLIISSAQNPVKTVALPNCNGSAATDGSYYYYNGTQDGKQVVFRADVSNLSTYEVIHDVPNTNMSPSASFKEDDSNVYITYSAGSGPIMSTDYSYKINADGSLSNEKPKNYLNYKHGALTYDVCNEDIELKVTNFGDGFKFVYTLDGVEKEITYNTKERLGRNIDGGNNYSVVNDVIQIYNKKIYFTMFDASEQTYSNLYCIDTNDNSIDLVLDRVYGFYAFGAEKSEDGTKHEKLLIDSDNKIYVYDTLTGEKYIIEDNVESGLHLIAGVGENELYTLQTTLISDRILVKKYSFDDTNILRETLLDTTTWFSYMVSSDKLVVALGDEVPNEEIRLLVVGEGIDAFRSSDKARGIFIFEDTLIYGIDDFKNTAVVNLK
ncbi:MAG: hypothetical protein IJB70_04250 [Clostridia bacterium]|nr:hypothetical protein [Clostridia bacterium]